MRVLIADDDRKMAEMLAAQVTLCGAEVAGVVTTGGLDVIQQHHRLRPDLVIMDVIMPRFNGLTVCHAILSRYPEMKVVLISGFMSEHHPFIKNSGASMFLAKPFRLDQVRAVLEKFGPVNHAPQVEVLPDEELAALHA
jgi:CheY-like chemotaxis protein